MKKDYLDKNKHQDTNKTTTYKIYCIFLIKCPKFKDPIQIGLLAQNSAAYSNLSTKGGRERYT